MAQTISISAQNNTSLGTCFLLKWEDDYTGDLYGKCLYPMSDYSPQEAMDNFIAHEIRDDIVFVDGIFVLDDFGPEIEFFARTFKCRYGIEYRNMSTAIHHIAIYNTYEDAIYENQELAATESAGETLNMSLLHYVDDIEINFRDIETIYDEYKHVAHPYYDDGQHGILLVNDIAYDIYEA